MDFFTNSTTQSTAMGSAGRSSVDELNQEIERLVLQDMRSGTTRKVPQAAPEGHRAPIAELFRRSVSTQTTPLLVNSDYNRRQVNMVEECNDENEMEVMCCTGLTETRGRRSRVRSRSDDEDDEFDELELGSRCPSSTGICCSPVHIISVDENKDMFRQANNIKKKKKILTREPPDGCERVKIVQEDYFRQINRPVLAPCPQKSGFVLLPSQSSAFLPLNCHRH